MAYRDLDVLDAAEQVAVQINELIDKSPRRLLYVRQLRDAAQSISANISEGFGRGRSGRDRNRSLLIARGETEEAIRHLTVNYRTNRVSSAEFWPIRNRLVVITKMVTALVNRPESAAEPTREPAV